MKSKLVLLALLLASSSKAAMPSIVISATGGLSIGGVTEKKKAASKAPEAARDEAEDSDEEEQRRAPRKSVPKRESMEEGASEKAAAAPTTAEEKSGLGAIVDGNISATFSKGNFFFGINGGYMYNFGSQTVERGFTHDDAKELIAPVVVKTMVLKQIAERGIDLEKFKTIEDEINFAMQNKDVAIKEFEQNLKEKGISLNQSFANKYEEFISYAEGSKQILNQINIDIEEGRQRINKQFAELESSLNQQIANYTDSQIQLTQREQNTLTMLETEKAELPKECENALKTFDTQIQAINELEKVMEESVEQVKKFPMITKKSISAQHSHMFYAGPVFGYNFNEKVSAGLSLNYVASSVSAKVAFLDANKKEVEGNTKEFESEIFHGFMPTIFASYAIGKGISAKVSVGYAIFFDKDAQVGKASELVELGNVFIATAGVSFKAV